MRRLTDEQLRLFVEKYGDTLHTNLTERQERALAAKFVGVTVERAERRTMKDKWCFIARLHTGGRWRRRYAGQSLQRALMLRVELVETYGRR